MDDFAGWKLVILLFITLSSYQPVSGSGTVAIKLVRFVNPGGEGANGHCCDGKAIFCFGACDHFFTVCLDNRNGPPHMNSCPYGKKVTGRIENANSITFGSSIGGTANPLTFAFTSWPDTIKLKVNIEDHDDGNDNDFVDKVHNYISTPPARDFNAARWQSLRLRHRVTLDVQVKVYCNRNFYGRNCDVTCQPRDDHQGHYTCNTVTGQKVCRDGWRGDNCELSIDDCASDPCKNGAICLDGHRQFFCICRGGFKGPTCNTDINECESAPCKNGGLCMNFSGSYNCSCTDDWTGADCSIKVIDPCDSQPCENSGTCVSNKTRYTCVCDQGWEGVNCSENINECLDDPCHHGGTCIDEPGDYRCLCMPGQTGKMCQTDIDECESSPCQNGATCIEQQNGYRCDCIKGYGGQNCEYNIDDCASTPCMHNGTCIDRLDGYHCECINGTIGDRCQTNVDECAGGTCKNNATCIDMINAFECNCLPGFTGRHCENDIDECLTGVCQNGAYCENNNGSFKCHCLPGFLGHYCETNIDECESSPCQYNGTCQDEVNGYSCTCIIGVTGKDCELNIDDCKADSCKNNGTCMDLVAEIGFISFELVGKIGESDKNKMTNVLKSIVAEKENVSVDQVEIKLILDQLQNKQGGTNTKLTIRAYSNGNPVSLDALEKIFTPARQKELQALLPFRNTGPSKLTSTSSSDSAEKLRHKAATFQNAVFPRFEKNWAASHWYAVLIIAAIVLVLAFLPVAIYIRRRRRTKNKDIRMSDYWPSSPDLPSHGFDNLIYSVEHQPYNSIHTIETTTN